MEKHGVLLQPTNHPTLKYMSPTGCIVEPQYRLLCTLHTCAISSHGFKAGDPEWTKKYFHLRDAMEIELWVEESEDKT